MYVFLTTGGSQYVETAIRRIEGKLAVMETKLEILTLKEEAISLKMDSGHTKESIMLENLIRDVESLKGRQDMLFAKQDLMHATLAGEAPVTRNYRSLSGSSIVAWSPVPNSPPFVPPFVPPHKIQAPSLTPTSIQGQLPQCQQSQHCPSHLSQSADELSVLSADKIESLLSQQVEGQNKEPQPQSELGADLCSSAQVATDIWDFPSAKRENPPHGEQSCIPCRPSSAPGRTTSSSIPELGTLLKVLGIEVPPPAQDEDPLQAPTDSTSTKGTEGANQAQRTRSPLLVSASDEYFAQTFTSGNLIPASVVIEARLKNRPLDMSNVGRFAILLARCSFFGDDVLHVSTLKGKGNRRPLDEHKLRALMSVIHDQFPLMSQEEFAATVQPRVERALRDCLKPSGTLSKMMF